MNKTRIAVAAVILFTVQCASGADWRQLSNVDLFDWLQENRGRFSLDVIPEILGKPDQEIPGMQMEPRYEGLVWIYRLPGGRSLRVSKDTEMENRDDFRPMKVQLVEQRSGGEVSIAWTVHSPKVYIDTQPESFPGSMSPTDVPPSKTVDPLGPAKG